MKIFLPAGNTPKPLYEKWRSTLPGYLADANCYQIDEVLNGENPFAHFFRQELPNSVRVTPVQEGEVHADVALLGLGLNGHVGFHEPGICENFVSGCVRLAESTTKTLGLKQDCWGETYGVGAFKSCDLILLLVRGPEKQTLLEKLKSKKSDAPAQAIVNLPQTIIINLR